jgi:hypothetical protein
MKKQARPLSLNLETVRNLTNTSMARAVGGGRTDADTTCDTTDPLCIQAPTWLSCPSVHHRC